MIFIYRYINTSEYNPQDYILKNGIRISPDLSSYISSSKYLIFENNIFLLIPYLVSPELSFKIIKIDSSKDINKGLSQELNNYKLIAELKSIRDKNFINSYINRYKMEDYIYFMDSHITDFKVNSKGELFFTDILRNLIWKVVPDENKVVVPQIFAGSSTIGFKDGKGEEASFYYPSSISFDENDNMYVADSGNNAIRKITPDGVVSTFYSNK